MGSVEEWTPRGYPAGRVGRNAYFSCDVGTMETKRFGVPKLKFQFLSATTYEDYPKKHVTDEQIEDFVQSCFADCKKDNISIPDVKKTRKAAQVAFYFAQYCEPAVPNSDLRTIGTGYYVLANILHDDMVDDDKNYDLAHRVKLVKNFELINRLVLRILAGEPYSNITEEELDAIDHPERDLILYFKVKCADTMKLCDQDYVDRCIYFVEECDFYVNAVELAFRMEVDKSKVPMSLVYPGTPLLNKNMNYLWLRTWEVHMIGFSELFALPEGGDVSREIRNLPEFKRFRESLSLSMVHANDLFSFKKEFDYATEYAGDSQNYFMKNQVITFLNQQDPSKIAPEDRIPKALADVAKLASEEVEDSRFFGQILLDRFPENEALKQHIRKLRWVFDGGVIAHAACKVRYFGNGVEMITEDDSTVRHRFV